MTKQEPPLLYQLEHDPSERFPLDPTGAEYAWAMDAVLHAVRAHRGKMAARTPELDRANVESTSLCCPGARNPAPPWEMCTCGQA